MTSLRHLPRSFWADDRGLTAFLGFLLLATFVLPPIVGRHPTARALLDIFFCAVLVGGALTAPLSVLLRRLIATVAVLATLARILDFTYAVGSLRVTGEVATLVSLVLLAVVVLAQVLRAGPVTIHRIVGAIAAYFLFGLAWGYAYQIVAAAVPSAFNGITEASQGRDLIYYSFVTLTTMGYGDITPVHDAARALAMLEGLVGQLYPAILVARLVSLEVQSRS